MSQKRWAAPHAMLGAVAEALDAEPGSACLLDAAGSILWVNQAWDRFAAANGGAPRALGAAVVGTPFLDHVAAGETRAWHAEALDRARALSAPAPVGGVVLVGECNSEGQARLMASRFEPLRTPSGELLGLSAVYTFLREVPIGESYPPVDRDPEGYRGTGGLIRQCSCCRRVRDPRADAWDLVPSLVARVHPDASHGICPLCVELHYPTASPRSRRRG
ncbi:MAG TPA: hypothetical protein VMT17_07530 [Anaeromyxobacteraceae bacterium]|nr:hypothetical protein [Anaeromyxobacteraceae bacterium]